MGIREDEQGKTAPEAPAAKARSVFWIALATFCAAGTLALGLLNVFGAKTSPVVNVTSALMLVAAFLFTLRKALGEELESVSSRRRRVYVASAVTGAVVLLVAGIATRVVAPLEALPGTQDVAIVGFRAPSEDQQHVYDNAAAALARALPALPDGVVHDYSAAVAPPLGHLAEVRSTPALDEWVIRFVAATDAELVVAGYAEQLASLQTAVRIAVFLPIDTVVDAAELSGWYVFEELLLDGSLDSAATKRDLTTGLAGQLTGLMTFLAGLDAWQAGHAREAVALFDGLVPSAGTANPRGTLADLARLFRGHAFEAQARAAGDSQARSQALDSARADYQAVSGDSPVAARASLSLATNDYLHVTESACQTENPSITQLAETSETLEGIGADVSLPEIVRLKAQVNRAQVEECRRLARATTGDPLNDEALLRLTALRAAEDDPNALPKRQIAALANSILATRLAGQGDLERALTSMAQALELEPRFELQSIWRGLASSWLLSLCRLSEGEATQVEALRQLSVAVERGRVAADEPEAYAKAFEADLAKARESCPANEMGSH